jgi:hypothetical protein
MSWVTIDRICQEEADGKERVRRDLGRSGKPLRSSAEPLSDDDLAQPDQGAGGGPAGRRLRGWRIS